MPLGTFNLDINFCPYEKVKEKFKWCCNQVLPCTKVASSLDLSEIEG